MVTQETLNDALMGGPARPRCGEWVKIDDNPPEHGKHVLLGWRHWYTGEWQYEAGPASWGGRTAGYSNRSFHGEATHWTPLPDSPEPTEAQQGLIPIPDGYAEP